MGIARTTTDTARIFGALTGAGVPFLLAATLIACVVGMPIGAVDVVPRDELFKFRRHLG